MILLNCKGDVYQIYTMQIKCNLMTTSYAAELLILLCVGYRGLNEG